MCQETFMALCFFVERPIYVVVRQIKEDLMLEVSVFDVNGRMH